MDSLEINRVSYVNQPHFNELAVSGPVITSPNGHPINSPQSYYFAYGSNLSLTQMQTRCPTSRFIGVGLLSGWRWIINERGYANIVVIGGVSITEDADGYIYGLVYALSPADEDSLDMYEGVPEAYTKDEVPIQLWLEGEQVPAGVKRGLRALVYIDRKRMKDGIPRLEYIQRMRRGMLEAEEKGLPRSWMRRTFQKWFDVS